MGKTTKSKKEKFLYMDLRNRIMEDYVDKPYFTPLKSERELSECYKVSRPTVRKAVMLLEEEGFVKKIPGKGSVFLGTKEFVESGMNNEESEISFYNNVYTHGDYTSSKVLLQNIEPASPEIAIHLNVKERSLVFHLERLRYINGKLYSLANAYVPYNLCPDLLKKDFTDISLHNTIEEYGIFPYRAKRIIEIGKASDYEALHLNIKQGDPIAIVQTITEDIEGNVLEYAITKSPADKMRIEMNVYNSKWKSTKKCRKEGMMEFMEGEYV